MPYVPERGDLVWLKFSPQAGHEHAGRRPATQHGESKMRRLALSLLAMALVVLTAQLSLAKSAKKVVDKGEEPAAAVPTPSTGTTSSGSATALAPAPAAGVDPKDAICTAACAAERKIKCSATDPSYKKEKFRTLADHKQGPDECVKTCKAQRAGNKHCLKEDTALRKKYIATLRCFPDGRVGSSECEQETLDLMNCFVNPPR